jgi:hypothetical protein
VGLNAESVEPRCRDLSGRARSEAAKSHDEAILSQEGSMGEFLKELWAFMKERKKFWLLPIIVMLVLLGSLIVLTQGSAVAPFIYTLF